MSSDKKGAGAPGAPDRPERPERENRPDQQRETLDVGKLFASLRAIAKEEASELSRLPADTLPRLSDADRARIAAAIGQAQSRQPATSHQPAAPRVAWGRRRRTVLAVAGPLAIAAGLVLALRPFPARERPLPAYELALSGGIKELRGTGTSSGASATDRAPIQRVGRQTEIVAVCRPEVAVEGPVAVRLFLIQSGTAREVSPRARSSASGSIEIRVNPIEDGGATPGRWSLRVVAGRPAAIQTLPVSAALAPADGPDQRWLTADLEVVAD
jgi:hypothetical protein